MPLIIHSFIIPILMDNKSDSLSVWFAFDPPPNYIVEFQALHVQIASPPPVSTSHHQCLQYPFWLQVCFLNRYIVKISCCMTFGSQAFSSVGSVFIRMNRLHLYTAYVSESPITFVLLCFIPPLSSVFYILDTILI